MRYLARRLTLAPLAIIAVLALIAVPAALAQKPVVTVVVPQPYSIPAGFGCSFEVAGDPHGTVVITDFGNGRTLKYVNAETTLTNVETGTSHVQRSNFLEAGSFDPAANVYHVVVVGRVIGFFYPGDQGPFGEVGENGAIFVFVGTTKYTYEADSGVLTSFSNKGTVTDLCAILAA